MACLKESALQGYLEEIEPSPLRQTVENRLASCARCRAAFDRVVARNRRVNSWLAKLSRTDNRVTLGTGDALADVLSRVETMRLFAFDIELPWYSSLYRGIRDAMRPRALPPLELTSAPVAVKSIAGPGTNPRALASSVILQGAIVAALMLAGTAHTVLAPATKITLIAPPPILKAAQTSASHGGGGQHSPLPPPKGPLPKPAPKVFTPPLATIAHPALAMDALLVAPADAWAAPNMPVGDPLGVFGGAGGLGRHGGVGVGDGPGVGDTIGSGIGGNDIGAFNVGNGVTRPELISQAEPEYSEEARKAKYSGAVMLAIVVNTEGRAIDIKVVKSLGMGLDEKAVEAVQKWRFKPGTNNGKPVPVRAQVEVNFRLL